MKGGSWEAEANQLDKLANCEQYEGLKVVLSFDIMPHAISSVVQDKRKRTPNTTRTFKLAASDGNRNLFVKNTTEQYRRSDSSSPRQGNYSAVDSPPLSVDDNDVIGWLRNPDADCLKTPIDLGPTSPSPSPPASPPAVIANTRTTSSVDFLRGDNQTS